MNFKLVILASCIAFVLSFFTALFSSVGFPVALLRAFLSSLFFGGLFFGIQILSKKFFDDGTADSQPAENSADGAKNTIGNKVDITISDGELAEDGDAPKFVLTGQNHMLASDDLKTVSRERETPPEPEVLPEKMPSAQPAPSSGAPVSEHAEQSATAAAAPAENAFKPVALGKSVAESSGAENAGSDEFPDIEGTLGANSILNKPVVSEDNIDEFPDMGNPDSPARSGVVTDSEFASDGKAKGRLSDTVFPDGSMAESKDTSLMAEAIRTILKKEE